MGVIRPKHVLLGSFAIMALFVLWNNERFLLDPQSPSWSHYHPIRWHLVPHGIGGTFALALGATQFSSRLRRRHIRIHRFCGKLYIIGTFVLAPVAIAMAFKISPWFMIPFTTVQSLTLMAFTAAAYLSIRSGNVAQHREWMVRSYAVVLIFLEGRVLMAIPAIGRRGMDSVVLVNWACLVVSLVAAEFILRWRTLFPVHRPEVGKARAAVADSA
jgi:uncharacterized membrane protein